MSQVEGTAVFVHEEEVDWSPVTVNLPVREGDRFVLLEDSRMEFEFNEGSFLRLGSDTDAEFHKLGEEKVRIRLNLGGLILRINRSTFYVVSTIFATVGLNGSGLYRLDLEPNGAIRIVVRGGSAKVSTVVSSRTLYEGEVLTIRGPDDSLSTTALSYLKDDFDFWSDRRDALQVAYRANRYLGRCYAGVSDLDRYDSWGYLSIYGHVWWPRAPQGWCPYRNGRWICYPGWGWTWISDEPWGWLPYHYGVWIYSPYYSRWCWVPQNLAEWSPATVDFYSGQGYVGWSPRNPQGRETKSRNRRDRRHWNRARISFSTQRQFPTPEGLTPVGEKDFLEGRKTRYLSPEPEGVKLLTPHLPSRLDRLMLERLRVHGIGEAKAGTEVLPGELSGSIHRVFSSLSTRTSDPGDTIQRVRAKSEVGGLGKSRVVLKKNSSLPHSSQRFSLPRRTDYQSDRSTSSRDDADLTRPSQKGDSDRGFSGAHSFPRVRYR